MSEYRLDIDSGLAKGPDQRNPIGRLHYFRNGTSHSFSQTLGKVIPIARLIFRQSVSRKWIPSGILLVAVVMNAATMAQSQSSIEIIARSTDPVLGVDADTEALLERALINNAGDVAFEVNLIEVGGDFEFDTDLVLRYSRGALVEVARRGPGGGPDRARLNDCGNRNACPRHQ